jgi:outer membrane protein with beta-barrel domain
MKRIIFTLIISVAINSLFAQHMTANTPTKSEEILPIAKFGEDDRSVEKNDTAYHAYYNDKKYKPKFSFGLTLSRLDLGYTKLIDNGSFTLSPQNQFLSYRASKTSNNGFDFIQFSARFSHTFKIYISGGFDWTLIRLRENITILPNQPVLTYRQDTINYSKNRFSSCYFRIPISFDFRSREDSHRNRFHFVFGPNLGFLVDGRVKQISEENGKQKIDDTYHFATFRYGAFTRIGYGCFGIYAKYYFNNMFEDSPEQDGLKNFSFGITLGF